MKGNTLIKLFDEFNKKNINYCVRSKEYQHLPYSLNGKDVDLIVLEEDIKKAKLILQEKGFILYPYTKPHYMYYIYDKNIGLIQLDIIILKNLPHIKKYKNFFISEEIINLSQKPLYKKLLTFFQRKIFFMGKGKLICFIGPDGSGKTTAMKNVNEALQKFPIKKQQMIFGALKPSPISRIISRMTSIIKVYWYIFQGSIVLTDRYLELTFRKKYPVFRKLLWKIAPTPSIVFIMKTNYNTLKNRRGDECLPKETIKDLYKLFLGIFNTKIINTEKHPLINLSYMMQQILNLYK